jgi:DNA-binding CsgD family transcriptional regulator
VPEQTFLREEFAAARAGQGRFVLVGGEAGIGKTTLVQDLVAEARTCDANILTTHCFDLTNTPPYGPWIDLFANLPADHGVPSCPAPFASGSTPQVSDQSALFATVRHFFDDLSHGGPALVLCEDIHWADPASLELLRHVARYTARWPILLIATYRIDELTKAQPLYRLLPALVREADAFRLDLRPLVPNDLRELVTNLYHLPPDDETRLVVHLAQRGEGNPFFTAELLRAMEEHGYLQRDRTGWKLAELDDLPLPSFVRQVIEARAARLGVKVQDALAIAAVIGHEVSLPLWQRVSGLGELALLDIVEQAVERHLLVASPDGSHVRFVHALTREALYESVTPPRRRLWHERAASVLMAAEYPDPDAVAFHLQHAGDPRAGEWLVRAADRAQRAYAWLTAADRLQNAANLQASLPNNEDWRCRLLFRLARLQRFSFPDEALDVLNTARSLAQTLNDPVLTFDILFQRGVLLSYVNQIQAGIDAIGSATEAVEALPPEFAHYFTTSGAWLADTPREDPAHDLYDSEAALDLSLATAALQTRRAALHWFGAVAGQTNGTLISAMQFLEDTAQAEAAQSGIRFARAYTHHGIAISRAASAQPDLARASWQAARDAFQSFHHHALNALTYLDELQDVALTFGADDPAYRHHIAAEAEAALARAGGALRPGVSPRLAWLPTLVVDGDWERAASILRDLPFPGNAFLERVSSCAAATLAWYRGEAEAIWTRVNTFFPHGPATSPGSHILQEALFWQRLAAQLALKASDLPAAQAWLTAHDAWLTWSGVHLGRAAGSLAWSRYHLAKGDDTCALSAAQTALDWATEPAQPLVQAAALRHLGELDLINGSLSDATAHLNGAITLDERCGAPHEQALALITLARVQHAQGEAEAAIATAHHAHDTLAPLGESVALRRTRALLEEFGASLEHAGCAASLHLTRRELDVLRLLVAHKTDREIAEDLFLGQRTIHTHVTHILNKLGVANRREAAREAERLDLV